LRIAIYLPELFLKLVMPEVGFVSIIADSRVTPILGQTMNKTAPHTAHHHGHRPFSRRGSFAEKIWPRRMKTFASNAGAHHIGNSRVAQAMVQATVNEPATPLGLG
jgi:hypothetical protein